jgi:hypothetical protein
MSAPPQAIAPNLHTILLNVYIQIANKMGFQKNLLEMLVSVAGNTCLNVREVER